MPDIPALRTELTDDPLTVGYSGMTDQEVVNSLKAKTRPGPIPSRELVQWAAADDRYFKIQNSAETDMSALGSGSSSALQILNRTDTQVDLADPAVVGMVLGLVAGGVLVQADADALTALSQNRVSRLSELGINGSVYAIDVQQSRA